MNIIIWHNMFMTPDLVEDHYLWHTEHLIPYLLEWRLWEVEILPDELIRTEKEILSP